MQAGPGAAQHACHVIQRAVRVALFLQRHISMGLAQLAAAPQSAATASTRSSGLHAQSALISHPACPGKQCCSTSAECGSAMQLHQA